MDALLCDEVWLMSPTYTSFDHSTPKTYNNKNTNSNHIISSFYETKEDCQNALITSLHKELTHMPQPHYIVHLESNPSVVFARLKAVQWLLQSQSRFGLSFGTVFNAVNYLDRFISMSQCHEWKYWMFELLSVACLSIACKFVETASPSFHEIQERLDYSFESSLIQRMELTVLKAMGWGLNCVTPFTYLELMTWEMNFSSSVIKPAHFSEEITGRLIELLASSLLDYKFLAFQPFVVATSGWKCLLKELLPSSCDAHIAHITNFISQDQMENLIKCDKLMEDILVARKDDHENIHGACLYGQLYNSSAYYPSSPVTVLTKAPVAISIQQVHDFSDLFKVPLLGLKLDTSNLMIEEEAVKKRKRQDDQKNY